MSCVGWRTSPGVGEAPLQRAGEGRELLRGTEVLQHPSGLPPRWRRMQGAVRSTRNYLNLLRLLEICIVRYLHVVNIGAEFASLG